MYQRSTYELAEFAEESISAFIMALSVLNSIYLSSRQEGIENVNIVGFSVIGACVAWGLIDGVVQYVGIEVRRARFVRLSKSLKSSMSLAQFTAHLQHNIDEDIVHNWGEDAVAQLFAKKDELTSPTRSKSKTKDVLAFFGVMGVYLLAAGLSIAPLFVIADLYTAIVISNSISTVALFLIGYGWAKSIEQKRPMIMGLVTAFLGMVLLAICIALGG